MIIRVTPEVDALLSAGTYAPWNEWPARFGAGEAARYDWSGGASWVLTLPRPLNAQRLANEAEVQWPGIEHAQPNYYIGEGGDVLPHPHARWYVFELAWGDCPAGCIHSKYRVVAIEADGSANELDEAELRARTEFLGLDQSTVLHAAVGDRISNTAKGLFVLNGSDGSDLVETRTFLNQVVSDIGWSFRENGFVVTEEDFAKSWKITTSHPYARFGYSVDLDVEPLEQSIAAHLKSAYRHPDFWIWNASMGWINDRYFPWLFHREHGWWFFRAEASTPDFWWVWDGTLGWLGFNTENRSGWYFWATDRWLYYLPESANPRWFYDFSTHKWFRMD